MMKSDMDDVAKRVESELETVETKDGITAEEAEKKLGLLLKRNLQ